MTKQRLVPLNDAVARQMRQMRRVSTRPELALRRELHRRGLRFRVNHSELPGRPDVVLTRARLAVFVDGCFWHCCPTHFIMPKNNRDFWREKLRRNVARDREKDEALTSAGWRVLHVWEHEDPVSAADLIERLWREGLAPASTTGEDSV